MEEYDLVVIGAGPGGYVAAIRAAQKGLKVSLIEREELGGVCLNRGCIPTKTLLESAKRINILRNLNEFGISVEKFEIQAPKIWQRKNKVVETLRKGIEYLFKTKGVSWLKAEAKLISKNIIELKTETKVNRLKTNYIIVATGSLPRQIPEIKFDHRNILDSSDILELGLIPKSLLIVGGGVIGCEFASIFSSFGTEVTIVELLDNLLPQEDKEISKTLERFFKKAGISIKTKTKLEAVNQNNDSLEVLLSDNSKIDVQNIVVCIGRRPNSSQLGLEEIGVNLEKGWVKVNGCLKTNLENIFAVGDVTGKSLLAHVASRQGEIAVENIIGEGGLMDYQVIPNCIFTFPEIASVGLNEKTARERQLHFSVAKFPFQALGKAHIQGEQEGFVKFLIDKKTEELLGAHIIGAGATELIATVCLAMQNRLKAKEISKVVFAHPSLAEIIPETIFTFYGRALHIP